MSMRDYPINTTGFLLDAEVVAYICLSWARSEDDIPEEIQALLDDGTFAAKAKAGVLPCNYSDVSVADELSDEDTFCFCSEFAGEIKTLFPEKAKSPIDEDYDDDYIAIFEVARESNLFHAAYESPDELLCEFKEKLADCDVKLPEDFDWWAHIVTVNGTYFC